LRNLHFYGRYLTRIQEVHEKDKPKILRSRSRRQDLANMSSNENVAVAQVHGEPRLPPPVVPTMPADIMQAMMLMILQLQEQARQDREQARQHREEARLDKIEAQRLAQEDRQWFEKQILDVLS
jgi:hypothetical protein